MKIITILGDSLSMARSEFGITYKTSYAYLLQELLGSEYHIINNAKRTNTITSQTKKQYIYDDVLTTDAEIFIVQLGIVDCSPRLFSNNQQRILQFTSNNFFTRKLIGIKSKHRRFFTKKFPKVYVTLEEFKKGYDFLIETILDKTSTKMIYLINIADTNKNNKQRSFGFDKNIILYNKIILELSNKYKNSTQVIDLNKISTENKNSLLEDGIHISKEVHFELAKKVFEEMKTLNI